MLPSVIQYRVFIILKVKIYNCTKLEFAGPNKTIETLLLEIKNELGEMKEEIQSLKENKTTGKGRQSLITVFELTRSKMEKLFSGWIRH